MSDASLQREPPDRPWSALAVEWLREHLFSSWSNILLTILSIAFIAAVVPPALDWAVFSAVWSGETREACLGEGKGACWPYIAGRGGQLIYGFYDAVERWRVDIVYVVGAVGIAWLMIPRLPGKLWVGLAMVFAFPLLVYVLLSGGLFGLPIVPSSKWGGLLLTLIISLTGIVVSLPLGILLALGRQSELPVIRWLSIGFIEFVRGVPLIMILFMASNLMPLFLPSGWNPDKLLRALVAISLFSSAYMAEIVRGGLAAIPKGQREAAAALGLGYWRTTLLITMPQALKISLPSIVSSCISLFKDTSLISIMGFFDFLQVIKAGNSDPAWSTPNTAFTGYLFAALVYFAFCFGMSRYSAYLERTVGGGKVGTGKA